MTIGEYIKKLRLEHNMTQEQLGKSVGVNRAAVNKWETGRVLNIRHDTFTKLAKVFDITPADLVNTGENIPVDKSEDISLLVNLYKQLDVQDKTRALDIINRMLKEDRYK